jgi:uncharacterized protein with HEPN domain
MWRDDALLLDVLLAAKDAVDFVRELDWTAFEGSRLHQNAVIRALEIIGEASGKLSAGFTAAHPEIPWRDIVSMRHRLIHAYSDVRIDIVWNVVQNRLPELIAKLEPLVPPDDQTAI